LKYSLSNVDEISGAFVKLRKEIISFVMSVGVEQLGSHWMIFCAYVGSFRKCRENYYYFFFKSEKKNGYVT